MIVPIKSFVNEANALDVVDTKTLSKVMENTVLDEILSVLNDPDIQNKRGQKLKNESDFESFASTKAKSTGLTTEQLASLMNSAYIYLPYINKMESKEEKGTLDVSIEGGIIWWRVKVDGNGTASIDKVLDATTSATNAIDLNGKDLITKKKLTYKKYTFGDKTFETSPDTYVQGGAMLAFAKNLSIKTRELSDFKLQAQVAEKDKNSYGFKLGLADGVHLDDGFFLIELTEDSKGNEKEVNLGFLRVSKSGKNKNNPTALSTANQIFGKKGDVGSIVMEHPRLGIDARIRFGLRNGLSILPKHTDLLLGLGGYYFGDLFYLTTEEATSAVMTDFEFSYNLAPIIGSSQTFLDFGFGFGVPLNEEGSVVGLTDLATDEAIFPLIWDVGLGLSKKIWLSRSSIPFGLSYNLQALSLTSEDVQFSAIGTAINATVGFEYMLTANTIFHFGIEHNMPGEFVSINITNDGESENYEIDDVDGHFDDMNLGGTSLRIGLDYSLGELGFDLFGFLDPLKKH